MTTEQAIDIEEVWREIEELAPVQGGTTFDDESPWDMLAGLFHSMAHRTSPERMARNDFVNRLSWAVPSRAAIDAIAEFVGDAHVLEVCAGRGLWAALLRARGVSITPTDLHPGHNSSMEISPIPVTDRDRTYCEVLERGALGAVATIDADVLMMVWPPLNHPAGAEALRAFSGTRLIFVGEHTDDGDPTWGCTGDDALHEMIAAEWRLHAEIEIPQWEAIHDFVMLYERLAR